MVKNCFCVLNIVVREMWMYVGFCKKRVRERRREREIKLNRRGARAVRWRQLSAESGACLAMLG